METTSRPRIHYSELRDFEPHSQLYSEWHLYRSEVGRLLAEGNEGRFVLIKGDEIIGIFDTDDEASTEGYNRYQLKGFLIQQIRTWEPVWRQRITYY